MSDRTGTQPIRILFVCLGNICRSPTAHGVFARLLDNRGLGEHIQVDSAGTGDWHIGHQPDARTQRAAQQRGYDLSYLRARQVKAEDFEQFDYILAMDHANLSDLRMLCPVNYDGVLALFLSYAKNHADLDEVPDPYAGGAAGFERVLDMVEDAAEGLLAYVCLTHFPLDDSQANNLKNKALD